MSTIPRWQVNARLSEIADEVDRTHERVHVTRNGREYVVLLWPPTSSASKPRSSSSLMTPRRHRSPTAWCCHPAPGARSPKAAPGRRRLRRGSSSAGPWCAARRGEYRVWKRIDEEAHQVVVLDLDHRRDAYHA